MAVSVIKSDGCSSGLSGVTVYSANGIIKSLSACGGGPPGSAVWGTITGTLTAQTDLITYLSTNYYSITNPAGYITLTSLSAGTGISYNNTTGVITNSAPDQTVVLTPGTGISISGTYPSFTISSTVTGGILYGTATQSPAGVYTSTISGVTALTAGDVFMIKFDTVNDGASTLNINALGAVNIYKNTSTPLSSGDIKANQTVEVVYDGTNFQAIGLITDQLVAYVHNAEGATITKGQVVYAYQASGNKMSVKLARADSDATSAKTIGLVYDTSIGIGGEGYIIIQGVIEGVNTAAFSAGDTLYLSGTTYGDVTATKPYAPIHLVYVGIVERANAGNGQIYVRCQNGYELDEIHNVQAQSPTYKDTLYFDNTVSPSQWKTASIDTILGYTPVTNARTISTTSPLSGGGDLTADRTLSIADAVADGSTKGAAAFTANDFDSASGVISIDYTNGQKATASQPGFLTAADWTTFNSKPSTDTMVFASAPNSGHTNTGGTTSYWAITGSGAINATENARVVVMPYSGTLKNFYVRVGAGASASGSIVLTVRKNAVDTAITVTFTSANGSNFTISDTTNTASVSAGDRITIGGTNNATSQAGTIVSMVLALER